jgi:hypothetical protein
MPGELLKAAVAGSIWMVQGGLGTPEYHFLPLFPPGVPPAKPSTAPGRSPRSDAHLLPGSEQPLIVESGNAPVQSSSSRQARGR